MRLTYHPEAEAELVAAAEFYAARSPGLGERFLQEFATAIDQILASPRLWPIIEPDLRCLTMTRFPFGIYYHVSDNQIQVIVVKHHNQRSDFWRDRLAD